MLYRFRNRYNYSWEARHGATRLAAAQQLPIGAWECMFVETATDVFRYDPSLHDRPASALQPEPVHQLSTHP